MMQATPLIEAVRHATALALLHFVWQGCTLWIVAACALHVARAATPQVRYAVCWGLLALLAACPAVTFWAVFERPQLAVGRTSSHTAPAIGQAVLASEHSVPAAAAWRSPDGLVARITRCEPWLLNVWLAGALVFAGRLAAGTIAVGRIKQRRQPLPAHLAPLVERMIAQLGFRTRPAVHVVQGLAQAMAVGLVKPLVLLPASWLAELPPSVLETVIAHELAHLRRWDLAINFVQRVLECALFFHPAVWWCSRRLRIEREICCDALAVALVENRTNYAKALTYLADRRVAAAEPLVAAGIGGSQMVLLERIRQVLGTTTRRQSRFYGVTCAAAGAIAASVVWLAGVAVFQPAKAVAPAERTAPAALNTDESQTHRFMLGAGVNSNAGITGTIDPNLLAQINQLVADADDQPQVPSEYHKTTLPDYTIEPPDVLFIEVLRLEPRKRDRIQAGDKLGLRVGSDGFSISGFCDVDQAGRIEPIFGSGRTIEVAGLSPGQATEKVRAARFFKDAQVKLALASTEPALLQPITGEHLVAPDGKVNLGMYGRVSLSGKTLEQAKAAIEKHLARFLDEPVAAVTVFAYNSKVYYVFVEDSNGERVHRFPITGNETVLDALTQVEGLGAMAKKRIWIARPMPGGAGKDVILQVDWQQITKGAATASNYQLLPGDRVFVTDGPPEARLQSVPLPPPGGYNPPLKK